MVSRLCLIAFGFGLQLVKLIYWMRFFFFNGCLDSLVLSCQVVSFSHVWNLSLIGCDMWSSNSQIESCLVFVYIYKDYNILIISFGTLYFMHLVSECSLNIFLENFFLTDWVTGYPGQVKSWVNLFLLRVKKIGFRSGIFLDGLGWVRKFWPVLSCLVFSMHIVSFLCILNLCHL